MSEPEGFLSRWARRKREAGKADAPADTPADAPGDAVRDAPAPAEPAPPPEPPTVDLSALPSLDSITAATDIRPFLAPGVPAELTRAALRRAWVADPQIRDFVGLAENQWDFTNPDAVPGFGTFGSADEIRKLVAGVMGEKQPDAAVAAAAASPEQKISSDARPGGDLAPGETGASEPAGADAQAAPLSDVRCSETPQPAAATQKDDAAVPTPTAPARRGHGGALPS